MLNSRSILGLAKPTGGKALAINIVVGAITVLFTVLSIWAMWGKAITKGTAGRVGLIAALLILLLAVVIVHIVSRKRRVF
jgi:succinate-acetate transporter protein